LNNERSNCVNDGNINGAEMGFLEVIDIAKSGNKPIIDIGPSQCGLNGLQYEDEISCSIFTSQIFRVMSKTNLDILW
jgi:hypothetical protein